jgi:general secretion pathway protein K
MKPPAPSRQRGAALLTAMVIVSLVATLASAMVWQQWRAVQVEAAERGRMQAAWILAGALDWARLILREDKRDFDSLDDVWANPLKETPLSAFLSVDKENTDDAPEAFLSGSITDAQERYNLRNLIDEATSKVAPTELAGLKQLCDAAGVSPDVASRIADGLLAASLGSEGAPLMPQSLAQLAWLGLDTDTVQRLAPYIVLLPVRTPVNLNTASREVIAASLAISLGDTTNLIDGRQRGALKSLEEARKLLPPTLVLNERQASVATQFFEVRGELRMEDRTMVERSLVKRDNQGVVTIQRERINLNVPGS